MGCTFDTTSDYQASDINQIWTTFGHILSVQRIYWLGLELMICFEGFDIRKFETLKEFEGSKLPSKFRNFETSFTVPRCRIYSPHSTIIWNGNLCNLGENYNILLFLVKPFATYTSCFR